MINSNIQVGINENVKLYKIEYVQKDGQKPRVDFLFGEAGGGMPEDDFAESEDGLISTGSGYVPKISVWPLEPVGKAVTGKPDRTDLEVLELSRKQVSEMKNLFTQFGNCYLPTSALPKHSDLVIRCGGSTVVEEYRQQIQTKDFLDLYFKELAMSFAAVLQPELDKPEAPLLRMLLVRQSGTNHNPSFRRNFLAANPIVESMVIPAEATKLKFTTWELSKGLNDGTPIVQSAADPKDMKDEKALFD